jgi:hypothetical protein
MTAAPVSASGPGGCVAEATARSPHLERHAPMAESLQPKPRKNRPHHGTPAQQLEALERGLLEAAAIAGKARAEADKANRKANFLAAKLASVLPDDLYPGETPAPCAMVDATGLPQCPHPESLAAELPESDEEWLASVAADLWPADEYGEAGS